MNLFICSAILLLGICPCYAQTQQDLDQTALNDFKQADKELNSVYQHILREYKTDTVFIKNLKKAQKLWLQFREAELNAKFPDREAGNYGSVLPMCWSFYKTELTDDRSKQLKEWLTGIPEGDLCAGSVEIKK